VVVRGGARVRGPAQRREAQAAAAGGCRLVSGEEHTVDMRRDAVGKLGGRADKGRIVRSGEGGEAEAGAGAGWRGSSRGGGAEGEVAQR
jgi:hypothetical protein